MGDNISISSTTKLNGYYKLDRKMDIFKTYEENFKKDEIEISSKARDYQISRKALSQISDTREDKVEVLKKAYESGMYVVNINDLSDKLLGILQQDA
jgi:negative regulator of flagellin synthesis FlgM